MIILSVFLFLVVSTIVIYFVSRRYYLRPLRFVLGNIVGYVIFALLGNLVFSIIMEDSGAIIADYGSLLGGGLSLTAVIISMIVASQSPREQQTGLEFANSELAITNYSTLEIFWVLAIRGLIAVVLAAISAIAIDFIVFVIYGFIGFEITDLQILIARIIYIVISVVISYLISDYLFRGKAKLIHQALYSDTASVTQIEQKTFVEDKPKNIWLWWLGGCGLLVCIVLGVIIFWLFYPAEEPSFPLDGKVSFPSTVKKDEDFELIINVTNTTAEAIFIKHIVLHDFLTAPSLLVGAKVINVEPVMDSEPLGSRNDMQFSYFREIKPGETQTVVFHMRTENAGTYYANVGVYARDPSKPDPAYIVAFHYATVEIKIAP